MKYGKRMRQYRLESGFTIKYLAQSTGLSEATIKSYESNLRVPNIDRAIILADAFQVSLDELFNHKDKVKEEA